MPWTITISVFLVNAVMLADDDLVMLVSHLHPLDRVVQVPGDLVDVAACSGGGSPRYFIGDIVSLGPDVLDDGRNSGTVPTSRFYPHSDR